MRSVDESTAASCAEGSYSVMTRVTDSCEYVNGEKIKILDV